MKKCSKCKKMRHIFEFYQDKRLKDGLGSWCKYCHKEYNQSTNGRKRKRISDKKSTSKNFLQNRARVAVNTAVSENKLPSIHILYCEICGKQAKEYHHYKGYKKEHQLDVVPLCRTCHIN